MEEKGWEKIKSKMPNSHIWKCCYATRDRKRGRAKGGFIIGKRKGWGKVEEDQYREINKGVVVFRIKEKVEGKSLTIISIYNTEEWENLEEIILRLREEYREDKIVIGGDFNARIGEEGGNDEEGWDIKRRSKDKVMNSRGKRLVELVGDIGGYFLNGTTKEDIEGEFTYVGPRGCSVIDYVIVVDNDADIVNSFKIEERVDSDHMPLSLEIMMDGERLERRRRGQKRNEHRRKGNSLSAGVKKR